LDVTSGKLLPDGPAHPRSIRQLRFSPDGKTLASLCHGGVLHLWRAADGKHLAQPAVPGADIGQAAYTADGNLLIVAGQSLWRLDGPRDQVVAMPRPWPKADGQTLSEDGMRVVLQQSAAPDGTNPAVRAFGRRGHTRWRFSLWDIPAGTELCKQPF